MERCESLVGPAETLLRLLGLWQPRGRGRLARLQSRLLAAITLAANACLVTAATLKLCVDPPDDLEETALCGLVASMCTGFFIKAGLFVAQGGTLRQSVRLLEDIRAEFCSGEHNEATRRRYQTHSNNIYRFSQVVALPAVIGWVLCPVMSQAFTSNDQDQKRAHRQLPAPVWLPDSFYKSPTYELLYAVNSFCALVSTESCLVVDMFFFHMMVMVAAELEVLNDNLTAIQPSNLQMIRTEKDGLNFRFKVNDKQLAILNCDLGEQTEDAANECLHRQLVKNVLHYREILRLASLLQSAMNVSIFSLLFINMANLCSSLFVAAVLLQRGDVGKAMNALFSIPPLLWETIAYSLFSHIMIDQSERLMYSAFSCDWVNSDARFKRSLLIFMTLTVRPVQITVGKMFTLSKQMLIQVLNGTYGLLNMLYYMHGSN